MWRATAPHRVPIVPLLAALAAGTFASPAGAAPERGTVVEARVPSRSLAGERRVWIYTPPAGARTDPAPADLLILFDGAVYLESIGVPAILDSLIAARALAPTVAVLVDNGAGVTRLGDLANRARFADFLADELVPWARRRANVTGDPRRTILGGSSAGGLAAAYAARRHPERFGNVLSQSGAFWRGNEGTNDPPFEWLTGRYAALPRADVRLVLEVGSRETRGAQGGSAPSILMANRRLRDVLRAKGYTVLYAEVPGGTHSPGTWRARFPTALAALARVLPVPRSAPTPAR